MRTDNMPEFASVVVFLGPDGSGKSTIIDLVEARLKENGLTATRFYFAPGYLRRYRPKGVSTITNAPHEGRQYGPFLTAVKISLMLLEFTLGMRQLRRRYPIALFDRYVHDLLVDPRRYRMARVRWWMRAMLALAPKPDLMVVISAPAEVIHGRKQEVPFEETKRQMADYVALAATFPNSLVVNNTGSPKAAAETVLSRLLHR